MSDTPIDLDKHRGMAAQKATDIRRVIADVEANAKLLRDKQDVVEIQLLAVPADRLAGGGRQGALRAESVSAGLAPSDTHHRDLVSSGACRPYPAFRRDLNETGLNN